MDQVGKDEQDFSRFRRCTRDNSGPQKENTVFYLQLVESADVKTADMEGQLLLRRHFLEPFINSTTKIIVN